mgnify:CR=1 FL=1
MTAAAGAPEPAGPLTICIIAAEASGDRLGAALMRAVGDRILNEGDTPFLHAYANNTGAIALYKHLGFELRTEITHSMWSKTNG